MTEITSRLSTALALSLGVLVAVTAAAPITKDDYPKNLNIDVLHYRFTLALRDDTDEIVGEAAVELRFLTDGVTSVRLDLVGAMPDGKGMTVTGVTQEGEPVRFTHMNDELRIVMLAPSQAMQRARFVIAYHGIPAAGLIIGPNKYGERTFFSDNWPDKARHWLPTIDHPYDKARSEFRITAPHHYQVISNGLLIEETDLGDGKRLTHWRQSVPIASWLYVLGVARFAVQHVGEYRGKPIQTWVYPQDRDAGFYDFAVPTKQVLEFYGNMVGPFSYEKLANVQSNSVGGGMEAATAIFYGDNSVTGERSVRWRNVIIHEIAHQWFGNSVTESDWDDVWLSEGFVTYFTLLFIEHAYGRDEFVRGLVASRDRVRRFHEEHPDYRIVHDDLTDMSQVTTSQTYQKGSWTLHMLRGLMGDEAFWTGIRAYYRTHQDANATTDDFRRAMENASGQDLTWFFEQWLYRGGYLEVEGVWQYDSRERVLAIELDQVQDGALFRMPMEIGITLAGERHTRIERVEIRDRQNEFRIPFDREPTDVVLDPRTWVLMDAAIRPR